MQTIDEADEKLVHAYLDGELDVATAVMVERKIAANPALHDLARQVTLLKSAIAEHFPREPVPPVLAQRIRSKAFGNRWASRQILMAASLLAALALSGPLLWTMLDPRPAEYGAATSELVDAHLRSLMASQPIDIASSDQHTVKPWFNGRLAQAPQVIDLHAQGFDLAGARIDVVKNEPVPTLVYRRRQHIISLTEVTDSKDFPAFFASQAKNGFNVVGWSKDGRSYLAVSDLNAKELRTFAELFRAAG